jgi:antitoxin Phd
MEGAWQLQDAKSRFSELFQKTLTEGPQAVSRHGRDFVIMVSEKEYSILMAKEGSLKEFFLQAPRAKLEISREENPDRGISL